MKVLVTGSSGLIGSEAVVYYDRGEHTVIGIDNLNDYYDVRLKEARRDVLAGEKGVKFISHVKG